MNKLEEIVARTREAVAERRREVPLQAGAQAEPRRQFVDALRTPGLSLIAEHKRRSPSAGAIREDLALEDVVRAYERGGASAVSILTEETSFGGSLDDLKAARVATRLPLLRKDFIVDPYQVEESLAAGADAILLIVAALAPDQLRALHEQALAVGLAALVEVHDQRELELAANIGARVIGINNRDLATLKVDTRRTFELLPLIDDGTVTVAESGFTQRGELDELQDAGVDAVLIGEALMRSPVIEVACRALTARA